MSDLIDRNDAVEAIEFEKVYMTAYKGSSNSYVSEGNPFKQYNKGLDDAIKAINNLASAEPEMKWIPVTERLPKTNGCYLVWRPFFFGGKIGMPTICYFDGQNTWHDAYGVDFLRVLHKEDITAWMPLPEPYRGEV